jgi:hypothetical protein
MRGARRQPGTWAELCALVSPLGLSKYADINLTRLIRPRPDRAPRIEDLLG